MQIEQQSEKDQLNRIAKGKKSARIFHSKLKIQSILSVCILSASKVSYFDLKGGLRGEQGRTAPQNSASIRERCFMDFRPSFCCASKLLLCCLSECQSRRSCVFQVYITWQEHYCTQARNALATRQQRQQQQVA